MNRQLCLLFFVAVAFGGLCACAAARGHAATQPVVTIGKYTLVSSQRVGRTVFDYTYTAQITNPGPGVRNVTATVTSTSAKTVIGDGGLAFGEIPTGATVTSSDTFTIRHDRTAPFDPTALVWNIQAEAIPVAVTVPNVVG